MNIYIFNYIINILIVKYSYNYIVLPFNNEKNSILAKEINIEEEIKSFLEPDKLYSLISLGDNVVELYFSIKYFYFFLGKGLCRKNTISDYSNLKSTLFTNISYCADSVGYINNVSYTMDKISLFTNIQFSNNVTLNNLRFLFGTNRYMKEIFDINKICGYIGLQIEYNDLLYSDYNFIKLFKKDKIIPTYTWSFLFFDNYNNNKIPEIIKNNNNKGLFLAGIDEKDYKEIFLTDDIRTTKVKPRYGIIDWAIDFNEIFFLNETTSEKSNYENNLKIIFDLESDFIIGTSYFFENIQKTIFKEYLEKNICFINEKEEEQGNHIIICEKIFSEYIPKFPNLYFYHKELNYTFVLRNKELFKEYGNHFYFMIINKIYYIDYWYLGTIFTKKYPFLFDYDKKTISFVNIYNNTNNMNKNNINSWRDKFKKVFNFIKSISIIIGIIIGLIIGKKIWDKKRKKRANELFDNYQYEAYENNYKNEKNIQSKENKLYEMN